MSLKGKIKIEEIVQKTSHNLAELFQIKDRGYIKEGYFADLVLFDLNSKTDVSGESIYSKCGWSPLKNETINSKIKSCMNKKYDVAYFSAEIGISSSIPTYSGGLGVLAGDHIKAAGDVGINMCAITLLYKEGYFKQRVDENGMQTETYPRFDPDPLIKQLDLRFFIQLQNRKVWVQAFKFDYIGESDVRIPIYFLGPTSSSPEVRLLGWVGHGVIYFYRVPSAFRDLLLTTDL